MRRSRAAHSHSRTIGSDSHGSRPAIKPRQPRLYDCADAKFGDDTGTLRGEPSATPRRLCAGHFGYLLERRVFRIITDKPWNLAFPAERTNAPFYRVFERAIAQGPCSSHPSPVGIFPQSQCIQQHPAVEQKLIELQHLQLREGGEPSAKAVV